MNATVTVLDAASTADIVVRRLDAEFPFSIPRHWFDDNPLLTAMMVSLSVSFPAGERFFIDSVRAFQDQIRDPDLLAQVRAFIGQEANHTREHMAMNRFFETKGYPALAMEDWVKKRVARIQATHTPEENLARTAALEHFTAIMAKSFMDHPEFFDRMHPVMARVWAWHAIEEVEHKSVAFDVFRETVNDEALRRKAMLEVTFFFTLINFLRTLYLMQQGGDLWSVKAWWRGLNLMWISPGVFRKIIPDYLDFYRKGFHPGQHTQSPFAERIRRRFLGA
jgi:predicted metal-dependent hydrolase